jgi:hypothetical protein
MGKAAGSFVVCVSLLLGGCESPEEPLAELGWRFVGLATESIVLLETQGHDLVAGTPNGLFRADPRVRTPAWHPIGLSGRWVEAVLPLDSRTFLGAVRIFGLEEDSTSLWRTTNAGGDWRPFQNGFGAGGVSNQVQALGRLSTETLLAGSGSTIAKSTDGGRTWRRVRGDWWAAAAMRVIETDPHWPELAWAGGETGFFQPFLLKSSDGGESWTELQASSTGDNAHYSIAVDPADSAQVYSGMEGRLVRSQDGGATWQTVLEPATYPYFFGVAVSSVNPEEVFSAGAANRQGTQDLVLYMSSDRGDTWVPIVYPTPVQGGARALVLVEATGMRTVYLGTGQGVYAYAFQ